MTYLRTDRPAPGQNIQEVNKATVLLYQRTTSSAPETNSMLRQHRVVKHSLT